MAAQDLLDNLSLDSDAAAMNDANFAKPLLDCLKQVFLHNHRDFARLERMKVDGILDRNFMHTVSIIRIRL